MGGGAGGLGEGVYLKGGGGVEDGSYRSGRESYYDQAKRADEPSYQPVGLLLHIIFSSAVFV